MSKTNHPSQIIVTVYNNAGMQKRLYLMHQYDLESIYYHISYFIIRDYFNDTIKDKQLKNQFKETFNSATMLTGLEKFIIKLYAPEESSLCFTLGTGEDKITIFMKVCLNSQSNLLINQEIEINQSKN